MNPKISIFIDAKNKAVATLTGLVTVGSKVDIEITGVPTTVPDWREIDPYEGKSLRFRVVDCLGNDLVRYPLVKKGDESDGDTWTVSDEGVYSNSEGCEVDFDTHKLRHAFNQVPFNESVEFGVILDSFVDSAQYAVGKMKIRQWCAASCDTPTVLPDWREILHGLKTDLESVYQSRTAAEAAASQSAASASGAAQSAVAADASESSAAEYAAAANEAKEEAMDAMLKYPYIDELGHWRVWSVTAGEWVDHGSASGGSVVLDDTVTQNSQNGVKSSGIWSWVKSLLPAWLTSSYAEPATVASVENKVDKIPGKGLSSNDYTTAEKNKLAGIEAGAEVNPTPVAPSTEIAEGAFGDAKLIAEFVNSSINNLAAFYLTKDAQGNAFPTKAALDAATTFYNGGVARVPTKNDYLIVLADEEHTTALGVDPTTRYVYDGAQWAFQYVVNNNSLTQAQVNAINSGITAALVAWLAAFKGNDTATTLASVLAAIDGKLSKSGGTVTGSVIFQDEVICSDRLNIGELEVGNIEIGYLIKHQGSDILLPSGGGNLATLQDLGEYLRHGLEDYDNGSTYAVGEFVRYNGAIYCCKTAITTAEAWTPAHWTEMSNVADFFSESNTKLTARVNELVDDKIGDINDALDELNGEVT